MSVERTLGRVGIVLSVAATVAIATALSSSCTGNNKSSVNSFTDPRDGKTYKTVKIGNQRWMAENLNYKTETAGSMCYASADSNCVKYGRLYTWEAANSACPAGWRLSNRADWDELLGVAGGEGIAGKRLKAASGWSDYKDRDSGGGKMAKGRSGGGTDDYGFSALPGSERDGFGRFIGAGQMGSWWSATLYSGYAAGWDMGHQSDSARLFYSDTGFGYLFSVRCVEGAESENRCKHCPEELQPGSGGGANGKGRGGGERSRDTSGRSGDNVGGSGGSFTDHRDGRKYRTVRIGKDTWMAENLNFKFKDDGWYQLLVRDCYNRIDSNCVKYGRLYDWGSAMKACPRGWHVPSLEEWRGLVYAAGVAGDAGRALKAASGWVVYENKNSSNMDNYNVIVADNKDGSGTDSYGFSALPGGKHWVSAFFEVGISGNFWSSTEHDAVCNRRESECRGSAYRISMYYHNDDVAAVGENKGTGCSVRCVRDLSGKIRP